MTSSSEAKLSTRTHFYCGQPVYIICVIVRFNLCNDCLIKLKRPVIISIIDSEESLSSHSFIHEYKHVYIYTNQQNRLVSSYSLIYTHFSNVIELLNRNSKLNDIFNAGLNKNFK